MKKLVSIITLLCTFSLHAGTMASQPHSDLSWFAAIGTGFSWTQLPGINNPNLLDWDTSIQGYNSSLGDREFYTFELGKQIHPYVDLSLLYLNHETFNYQMFQTDTSSPAAGFAGHARTRYFNLSNQSLLINLFLHPADDLYNFSGLNLQPFVNGGIGYGFNQVTNFYNVGTVDAGGQLVGSITSMGNKVDNGSFAWQAAVGVNIKPTFIKNHHLSVDLGYRYYNGGTFYGSNVIYSNVSGVVPVTPWSGQVKANQLFIDFRYTI